MRGDLPPSRKTAAVAVAGVVTVVVVLGASYVLFGSAAIPVESNGPAGSDRVAGAEGRAPGAGRASSAPEVGSGPGRLPEPAVTPPVSAIPEGGTGTNFELVGHAPLLDTHQYHGHESLGIPRGSNGEITASGDCVYVGSLVGHQPPLIVDVSDPADPTVVGPVPGAAPGVGNGIEGIEASGGVLVIDHREPLGSHSGNVDESFPERGLSVWDVSGNCRKPELVARHDFGDLNVHALRLWRDPQNPNRLLALESFIGDPDVKIVDLTGCPDPEACDPREVAEWNLENQTGISSATHEAMMSTDGTRIYAAQADPGFLVLDSSNLLDSLRNGTGCDPTTPESVPGDDHCLTVANPNVVENLEAQPTHGSGFPHTFIPVPDRPYALGSGESTGPGWDDGHDDVLLGKCPGSRIAVFALEGNESTDRVVDPEPVGEYGVPTQRNPQCNGERWADGSVPWPGWFSPHFPMAFHDVAFATYYGGGLRAIDISNASDPIEAGHFFNDPVEEVRWASYTAAGEPVREENGRITRRPVANSTHMFAFSYPIFHDGYLIYSDVHSGLYVLEYTGTHAEEIPDEGNCLPANPGAVEPGYGPCPPYGGTGGGTAEG